MQGVYFSYSRIIACVWVYFSPRIVHVVSIHMAEILLKGKYANTEWHLISVFTQG